MLYNISGTSNEENKIDSRVFFMEKFSFTLFNFLFLYYDEDCEVIIFLTIFNVECT